VKSSLARKGRRHRHGGDDGVAAIAGDRIDQRLEPAHLHGAGNLDLVAQRARQIDIEAGRIAVGAGEVERRVIGLGQEPDHGEARHVRPVRTPPRVPEAGHRLRGRLDRRAGLGLRLRRSTANHHQRGRDRQPGQPGADGSMQSCIG
jgi:hypothetical protein